MRLRFFYWSVLAFFFFSTGLRAADLALPTIAVPVTASVSTAAPLAVFLSGDGGWAAFDREISKRLAAEGWRIVGFDLRKYLWTPRTPEETTAAVTEVIRDYDAKWHHERIVVMGFSRGADLAPFVVNRLPPALRSRVRLVVLLSPGRMADFEFRLGDFLRPPHLDTELPVRPELQRLQPPWLLLHGADDDQAIELPIPGADPGRAVRVAGDHHLAWDYPTILRLVEAAYRGAVRN